MSGCRVDRLTRGLFLATAFLVASASAADWRPVFVSPDDQETWPAGDWVSVDSRLIPLGDAIEGDWTLTSRASAYINSAVYEGVFRPPSGDDAAGSSPPVIRGRFTWNVKRPKLASANVDLGVPSIALFDLSQNGEDPIWGLASDSRSKLFVEDEDTELAGRWAAIGVEHTSAVGFELRIPPSVTSVVRLAIPRSYQVESNNASVERLSTGRPALADPSLGRPFTDDVDEKSVSDTTVWEIRPGSNNTANLVIRQRETSVSRVPRLVTETMDVEVDLDSVRWRSDHSVSSPVSRARVIAMRIPDRAIVDAVFANGIRVESPNLVSIAGERILRVRPATDSTNITQIQIAGQLPRTQSQLTIPTLTVTNAQVVDSRVSAVIKAPLQLSRVEAVGYRQVDGDLDASAGDAVEFVQTSPGGRITLTAEPPDADVSAAVDLYLDASRQPTRLTGFVELASNQGSTFRTELLWPRNWSVENVRLATGAPVESWVVAPSNNGQQIVSISLATPLTPERTQQLRIDGRSRLTDPYQQLTMTPVTVRGANENRLRLFAVDQTGEAHSAAGVRVSLNNEVITPKITSATSPLTPTQSTDGARSATVAEFDLGNVPAGSVILVDHPVRQQKSPTETTQLKDTSPTLAMVTSPLTFARIEASWPSEGASPVAVAATFESPRFDSESLPQITLPDDVDVLSFQVDGITIDASANAIEPAATTWTFSPELRGRRLTVSYSLPTSPLRVRNTTPLPLPQLSIADEPVTIAFVSLALDLPQQLSLVSVGPSAFEGTPTFTANPLARVFGPLARLPQDRRFRPWSSADWVRLFSGHVASSELTPRTETALFLPLPAPVIEIELSNQNMLLGWSWVLWWLGLTGTYLLRKRQPVRWRSVLVVFVCASAATSLLVADTYSLIFGGLTSGFLFGLLIPRKLVRTQPRKGTVEPTDEGSTRVSHSLVVSSVVAAAVAAPLANGQTSGPQATEKPFDVLIPIVDFQALPNQLPQTVYVKRSVADRLRSQSATTGQLIRRLSVNVSRSSNAYRVDCTYNIVQSGIGSGVAIPLGDQVTLLPESIMVDGNPTPAIPLGNSVFVTTNAAPQKPVTVQLSYLIGPDAGNAVSVATPIPTAEILDATASVEAGQNLNVASSATDERDHFRLAPSRRLRIASNVASSSSVNRPANPTQSSDTPTQIDAVGSWATIKSDLATKVQFSIALPRPAPTSPLRIALPDNLHLSEPLAVSQATESNVDAAAMESAAIPHWQEIESGAEGEVCSISFTDDARPPSAECVISGSGWLVVASERDRQDRPTLSIGDLSVPIRWQRENDPLTTNTPTDTAPPRPQLLGSSSTVLVADRELSVRSIFRFDMSDSPLFSLKFTMPVTGELMSTTAIVEGRVVPVRVGRRSGDFDVLFDGAASGDTEVTVEAKYPRPRQGRIFLPFIDATDVEASEAVHNVAVQNVSRSPAILTTSGQPADRRIIWDDEFTFEQTESDRSRPVPIDLRTQLRRPESQTAIVVDAGKPPRIVVGLRSRSGMTRRRIPTPVGWSVSSLNGQPAANADSTLLSTTESSRTATVTFVPTSTNSELSKDGVGKVPLPRVPQTDPLQTLVLISDSDRRVVKERTFATTDPLPAFLVPSLPADQSWSKQFVPGASLTLTEKPTEAGPTSFLEATHLVWPAAGQPAAVFSSWSFTKPGLATIAQQDASRIAALVVDGKPIAADALSTGSMVIPVTSTMEALWQPKEAGKLALPGVSAGTSSTQFIAVSQASSGWSLRGAPRLAPGQQPDFEASIRKLTRPPGVDDTPPTTRSVIERRRIERSSDRAYLVTSDSKLRLSRQIGTTVTTKVLIALLAVAGLGIASILSVRGFWNAVANEFAARPRAVALLFGLTWWLFLAPSFLGIAIIFFVLWLTLFRPTSHTDSQAQEAIV